MQQIIMFFTIFLILCGMPSAAQRNAVQKSLNNAAANAHPLTGIETAISNHAQLPNIKPFTGEALGNTATPSAGNKNDGIGYFMPGSQPNSFFYFIDRTGKVYANWGALRSKYALAGYEFGALGWPAGDEYRLPDGTGFFQRFDHGFIYSHPKLGSWIVDGMIFDHWARNLCERGIFGYPISDETAYPTAASAYQDRSKKEVYISHQEFQNGSIIYLYDKIQKQYKILSQLKDPNFNPNHPH